MKAMQAISMQQCTTNNNPKARCLLGPSHQGYYSSNINMLSQECKHDHLAIRAFSLANLHYTYRDLMMSTLVPQPARPMIVEVCQSKEITQMLKKSNENDALVHTTTQVYAQEAAHSQPHSPLFIFQSSDSDSDLLLWGAVWRPWGRQSVCNANVIS